jgi:hypothetical protein
MYNEPTVGKKKKKIPASLHLQFPKSSGLDPSGFENLTVDGKCTVTIKGVVRRIESDPNSDWEPGRSARIEMTSCSFETERKSGSLDAALKKSERRV